MHKSYFLVLVLAAAVLALGGCGGPSGSPIDKIRADYKNLPTFSVILEDMKSEGTFVDSYYHRYRIIVPPADTDKSTDTAKPEPKSFITDWIEVDQKEYQAYQNLLGMTIYSKAEGKESTTAGPPGYEYVGNPRYGSWHTDSSGSSFWVFYGQYRLFSDLLGFGRINRSYYDDYRSYNTSGRPYYGPGNSYGTSGKITQQKKPNFYQRRMAKQKASFGDKVSSRAGRTSSSGLRGRSGGTGK